MKTPSFFVVSFILIFSINLLPAKSLGINRDEILLIFFIKEEKGAKNNILSDEDYMKNLMFKELYSTFNVGIPNQNIKFYYEMNECESSISQEYYLPKRSTTYKLKEENKNVNYSQELFILDKNKNVDDFQFILKKKIDTKGIKNYNSIGLGYNKDDHHLSFLSQLNKKKFIKKRIFAFLFGDDSFSETKVYDGQLLLGDYPHSISPYFNEKELKFISLKEKEKWIIEFDSVKYNGDELKDKNVILDVDLNLMIGPNKFQKKLVSSFFYELIDDGKCKEKSFVSDKDGQTYIFYSFDNSVKFKENPNLFFYSKALNETFKISFSDLFILYNQKYYFKIIFNKKPHNEWVLGQQFLNKYKFVFDLEEGKIGYYKSSSNKFALFIILFFFIILSIIFGIGYKRGYFMAKNESNLNNKKSIPFMVRKEYLQFPEENKNNEVNKKIEKEKDIKDKPKKE